MNYISQGSSPYQITINKISAYFTTQPAVCLQGIIII